MRIPKLVSPFKLVNHHDHPKRSRNRTICSLETNPTGGGGRVRGSVAGSNALRGAGACRFFHGRLRRPGTRARRSPAVHPRCTLRAALGGALAPSAGPLCAAHLAYSQPIHTGPCRMCVRPPRENPPNDRLHPTHDPGHRVPPTPNHRPSRPRPDASITVRLQLVRKAFA